MSRAQCLTVLRKASRQLQDGASRDVSVCKKFFLTFYTHTHTRNTMRKHAQQAVRYSISDKWFAYLDQTSVLLVRCGRIQIPDQPVYLQWESLV